MSYRAGAQGLESLGIPSGPPRIICDDCGLVYPIGDRRPPAQWFFDGKPPPKWTGDSSISEAGNIKRLDYCPRCKGKHPRTKGKKC